LINVPAGWNQTLLVCPDKGLIFCCLTSRRGIYPCTRQVQNTTFRIQETLHTHTHLSDQTVNLFSPSPPQQHEVCFELIWQHKADV